MARVHREALVPSEYILRVIIRNKNASRSTPRQNKNTSVCRGEAMVPRENRKICGILANIGHPQLVVDSANSYRFVWMCRVVAYTRFSAVDEALPFRGKGPK